MAEDEIVCQNAILAALNIIQKKCKGKNPMMVELEKGIYIFVPNPTPAVSNHLSCEEKVLAVASSDWALHMAQGLAKKLFGLKPGDPGYEEAVKRAALKIAKGAVGCEWVDIDELLKKWS